MYVFNSLEYIPTNGITGLPYRVLCVVYCTTQRTPLMLQLQTAQLTKAALFDEKETDLFYLLKKLKLS